MVGFLFVLLNCVQYMNAAYRSYRSYSYYYSYNNYYFYNNSYRRTNSTSSLSGAAIGGIIGGICLFWIIMIVLSIGCKRLNKRKSAVHVTTRGTGVRTISNARNTYPNGSSGYPQPPLPNYSNHENDSGYHPPPPYCSPPYPAPQPGTSGTNNEGLISDSQSNNILPKRECWTAK